MADHQSLSNASEVMKRFYIPGVNEQLDSSTPLKDLLSVNEEDVANNVAYIECHKGRNTGTGSAAEDGALPSAGRQQYKKANVKMKYHYGRIKLTGQIIEATKSNAGAFVNALEAEVTGITADLAVEENRMLWGCGYGVLGRWRSTEDTTEYTLQKKYCNNSVGGDMFGSTFGGKYLTENGKAVAAVCTLSSGITAITVDATAMAVSAVDESEADYDTITCLDPGVSEAASTFYVRGDATQQNLASVTSASEAGDARLEMMGIRGLVTDTNIDDILGDGNASTDNKGFAASSAPAEDTLQGIDCDTETWWKAQVDSIGGGRYSGQRPYDFTLAQKMFDKIERKAGRAKGPDVIFCDAALRREHISLCDVYRREVGEATIKGGYSTWAGPNFNGKPIVADDDCPGGEMYFLTLRTREGRPNISIYRMSGYDWMVDSGGGLLRVVEGYDQYQGTLFCYRELGVRNRSLNGVVTDLAYDPT